jgi:hypothetical protein
MKDKRGYRDYQSIPPIDVYILTVGYVKCLAERLGSFVKEKRPRSLDARFLSERVHRSFIAMN